MSLAGGAGPKIPSFEGAERLKNASQNLKSGASQAPRTAYYVPRLVHSSSPRPYLAPVDQREPTSTSPFRAGRHTAGTQRQRDCSLGRTPPGNAVAGLDRSPMAAPPTAPRKLRSQDFRSLVEQR